MRYECYYNGDQESILWTDSLDEATRWLDERYEEFYLYYFRMFTKPDPYEITACEWNAAYGASCARIFDSQESKVLDLRAKYPEELKEVEYL